MLRIISKYIPATFPTLDFADVKIVDAVLHRDPKSNITNIQTTETHATVDELNIRRKRLVQSVKYDRYVFNFIIKESTDISITKIAEECIILTDTEKFEAFNVELDYERLEGTYNYRVTVSFDTLIEDNESTNNYLISEVLLQKYDENKLYRLELTNNKNPDNDFLFTAAKYTQTIASGDYSQLPGNYMHQFKLYLPDNLLSIVTLNQTLTFTPAIVGTTTGTITAINSDHILFKFESSFTVSLVGNTYVFQIPLAQKLTFYTALVPYNYAIPLKEIKFENDNIVNAISINTQKAKVYELTFYLSESEALLFDWYASTCFYYENNLPKGTKLIMPDGTEINAIERIPPEIDDSKSFNGVYKRVVKFKYAELNFYHFADN